MSKLVQAIKTKENKTVTENGMKAFKSTLNANVDFFFKAGASRGKDILPTFAKAYGENEEYALRITQWLRDVRQGAGERQLFRDILSFVAQNNLEHAKILLNKIPELGRWDDCLVLLDSPLFPEVVELIRKGLEEKNGLLAKWLPRKGKEAVKLTKALGFTPKQYRKTIVGLSKTVEQQMCAGQWTEIEYGKVPSLASARYQKAFGKHDSAGYGAYIAALQKGEAKINAGAVYPYDVVKSIRAGNASVANEQWKALPDFVGELKFLPVVDVSGSMTCAVGGNPNLTCMDVAISLGLYLSERNKSIFKDSFITFSANPVLQTLSGTLANRCQQLQRADWGYNTNLEAVFKLILSAADKNKLAQEDMPDYVIILSDMQFDSCATNKTALKMIKHQYKKAGYEMPKLIFWNLNAKDNVPVKFDTEGTALVSGCSPSIMKGILAGKSITPESMMLDVILNERYSLT